MLLCPLDCLQPYSIYVKNITQYNINQMPGGLAQVSLFKPAVSSVIWRDLQ
jgi:hypothetical protein